MKTKIIFSIIISMNMICIAQNSSTVTIGKIDHIENFKSKFVDARNVDVWLPEGYTSTKKYAVLYMHDGQMLFDSTITWNKEAWEVDETMGKLLSGNSIKECIVVGVWNLPKNRFADYFPQKIIDSIPEPTRTNILEKQLKGKPNADNYLKFLVTELKPYIDKKYATKTDAQNTFMMGSSMGGLISLYAICEYPKIFGGVACLSTHTPLASYELVNENTDKEVASKLRNYLVKNLPKATTHKIYFDFGDKTLDAIYKPYQTKIDKIMINKGYNNTHWQTLFFKDESHSEKSWAKRLDIPIIFLLSKN